MTTEIKVPEAQWAYDGELPWEDDNPLVERATTPISMRVVKSAVSRRWRLCLALALVGAAVGGSLHLLIPRKYAAVSDLYLAEPAGSAPGQAIADDVSLLQTRAVAQQVVQDLRLHETATAFLSTYKGRAVSNSIISVTVSAPTPSAALERTSVVTRAFLALRSYEFRLQTNVAVDGLRKQIASLNSQIGTLDKSINALSSSPGSSPPAGSGLTTLINQRSGDASQVTQLQAQIQQNLLNEASIQQVSRVLDPPAPVPSSTKKVIATDGLSGLVAGLSLGIGGVALGALLSDRPHDRSEVAAALEAPVELSIPRLARRRLGRWRRLKRALDRPDHSVRMIERRLRSRLESAPDSALGIVTLEASVPATLATALLICSLAEEGKSVLVADAAHGRPLAAAFGVRDVGLHTISVRRRPISVFVAPEDPVEMAQKVAPDDVDAVLVLADVEPAFGAEHLRAWVSDAVVIVGEGKASVTRISATGELLRQAHVVVRSAVLVGSLPTDDTSGAGQFPGSLRVG